MNRSTILSGFIFLTMILAACGPAPLPPTPTPSPTSPPKLPPLAATVTLSPSPIPTVAPTSSPEPSQTPTLAALPIPTQPPIDEKDAYAFSQNQRLGRGMNIGNALEAPKEGDWGVTLTPELFDLIKSAGFNSVRLPVRWSGHTSANPPYTIDAAFLSRVDWAVKQCLDRQLAVILDMHSYAEIMDNPETEKAKFLSMWTQLAAHYKNYPDSVYFELLNEPYGMLATAYLNDYYNQAIQIIRKTNPKRTIILGPGGYYSFTWLDYLNIDPSDRNIIISIHYYSPFHFTHQGAEWVQDSNAWLGTRWTGTQQEKNDITHDFSIAAQWASQYKRPIYLGEFGAYHTGLMADRVIWTNEIARQAESFGWSWAYWEFCAGFGIYNLDSKTWNEPLYHALMPVQ